MNAGARAIENNKKLDGTTYIYDVFSEERDAISYREASEILRSSAINNGWIPVSERLPEEKENPITRDYLTYECTFSSGKVTDIRYYSFGGGHWWHGHGCMDGYVTAWRERPEPYKEAL
jgi:hypothetical protein